MRINRKLTGVLAWGGLALIFAVPSAEIVSSQLGGAGATAVTPAGIAPLAPAATPATNVAAVDPVDDFIRTGKPMPSYISDSPAAAEPALAPVVIKPAGTPMAVTLPTSPAQPAATPAAQPQAVQTAAIPPQPMPAHMRPLPPFEAAPAATAPAPASTAVVTPSAPVVIVDETTVDEPIQQAAVPPRNRIAPPADVGSSVVIEDLEDWDGGSLADYLQRRGLISDDEGFDEADAGSFQEFDEDGFFLDEGPNTRNDRRSRVQFRDRDGDFIVFPND